MTGQNLPEEIIVALVGELNVTNLGDPLLFECTEYCLKNWSPVPKRISFEYCDIQGRLTPKKAVDLQSSIVIHKKWSLSQRVLKITRNALIHIFGETAFSFFSQSSDFLKIKNSLLEYYDNCFKNKSLIIIVGAGTLKYDVRLDFGPYYKTAIDYAEQHNLPVIVSGVGVESKYNPNDIRCRRFSKALSRSIVKAVTTRDNKAELLKYIHNRACYVKKAVDFGMFANETYGIDKEASDCVGIGIITSLRFSQYKREITEQEYNKTIIGLIRYLDQHEKKWKLFTNGDNQDAINAISICKAIGRDPEEVLLIPSTPKALVKIISQFEGIITSRLHSCIIAYSLDIPFIALSWNNKLEFFAEYIGCPERIISNVDLGVDGIMEKYQNAMDNGYNGQIRSCLRDEAIECVKEFHEIIDTTVLHHATEPSGDT